MLKDLAIMSGWKSIKALTACENFTDDHKAWQILQNLNFTYLFEFSLLRLSVRRSNFKFLSVAMHKLPHFSMGSTGPHTWKLY